MSGLSFDKDMFPSKFLRAVDLDGDTLFKIKSVALEEVGQEGEHKPVVRFDKEDRGWVLNITNGQVLREAFGDDSEDWVGHTVCLFPTKAQFGKKLVDAIRVRVPEKKKRTSKTKAREAQPDLKDDLDDDIPDFAA